MTARHHLDRPELDYWDLYGPKKPWISWLVDRLAFDHKLRVREIEDFILQALKDGLAQEEARQKP